MVYALFAACQQELTVKDLCFLMTFVLATNNEKKLAELRAILSSLDIEIISLSQAGVFTAPEETGNTFEENALIKARAAMSATGLPAIADDSGLEVTHWAARPAFSPRGTARRRRARTKTETKSSCMSFKTCRQAGAAAVLSARRPAFIRMGQSSLNGDNARASCFLRNRARAASAMILCFLYRNTA